MLASVGYDRKNAIFIIIYSNIDISCDAIYTQPIMLLSANAIFVPSVWFVLRTHVSLSVRGVSAVINFEGMFLMPPMQLEIA